MNPPIAGKRDCEEGIKIYPVRYAFMGAIESNSNTNFDMPTGMNDVNKGAPYVNHYKIRTMREGWIYIKEMEGEEHLRIVKYSKSNNSDTLQEQFKHYLFNKEGTEEEKNYLVPMSCTGLPFASKGVTEIKIAYTQHELSLNVLKQLNNSGNADLPMQKIDLAATESDHAVHLTTDNLNKYVEDYKDGDLNELLNVFTLEQSFGSSYSKVTVEEQFINKYLTSEQEKNEARVVTLYDPVGCQLDVTYAHAMTCSLKDSIKQVYAHPYTIGKFVEAFIKHDDDLGKKVHRDRLNSFMEETIQEDKFNLKIDHIISAFKFYFSVDPSKPWSLYNYFKYFFDASPTTSEFLKLEIQKVSAVFSDLFVGIGESKQGQKAIEEIISHAYSGIESESDVKTQKSTYLEPLKLIRGLLDIAYDKDNGNKPRILTKQTQEILARVFNSLGAVWAKQQALSMETLKNSINQGALQLKGNALKIANAFTNAIIEKGLNIKLVQSLSMTSADIIRQLKELSNNLSPELSQLRQNTLAQVNKIFGRLGNTITNSHAWKVITLAIGDIQRPSWLAPNPANSITTFKCGVGGVSAYFNMMTAFSIMDQKLTLSVNLVNTAEFTRLIGSISLFVSDMAALSDQAAKGALKSAQWLSKWLKNIGNMKKLLRSFMPSLKKTSILLAKLAASKAVAIISGVGSFFMAFTSALDGWSKWKDGKILEGVLFFTMAVTGAASAVLGAAVFITAAAGGSALSVVGLPASVVLGALALVTATIGLILFWVANDPIEDLLFYCFWGKTSNYTYLPGLNIPTIDKRLAVIESISDEVIAPILIDNLTQGFERELQDFQNMLFGPSLVLNKQRGQIDFKFTLPGYNTNYSKLKLIAYLYVTNNKPGGWGTNEYIYLDRVTREINDIIKINGGQCIYEEVVNSSGVYTLSFSLNTQKYANFYIEGSLHFFWIYQLDESTFIPVQYFEGASKEVRKTSLIGMWDTETISLNTFRKIEPTFEQINADLLTLPELK